MRKHDYEYSTDPGSYKSVEYVKSECTKLALELSHVVS